MTDFTDAVGDTRNELEKNAYDPTKAIVYCHPATLRDARDEMDHMPPFTDGAQVYGMAIEETPNVPENVVMAVHLDAMRLGPNAVAFATIDDE